jgi:hypothetical protein
MSQEYDFICPISFQYMTEPVMLVESQQTYEKEEITEWLKSNNLDPLTRLRLRSISSVPNKFAEKAIVDYLENQPLTSELMNKIYLPQSWVEDLKNSVKENNIVLFRKVLEKACYPFRCRLLISKIIDDKNLLTICCESASFDILKIALEKIDIKAWEVSGITQKDKLSLFTLIVQRFGLEKAHSLCSRFHWEGSYFQEMLKRAIEINNIDLANTALSLGAIVNIEILIQVYDLRNTTMIRLFLSKLLPAEESSDIINDLLLRSIQDEYFDLIEVLLLEFEREVNPNISTLSQKTALMLAIEMEQTETVSLLLDHPQINIHQKDTDGNTALHYAVLVNDNESVELLIERGASIREENDSNQTPIQLAKDKKNDILKDFMKRKSYEREIIPPNEKKAMQLREKERQKKLAPLINGLLRGDLEETKQCEDDDLFGYRNEEGLYPLGAAIYGMNYEAVKYVESKLDAKERRQQWLTVDLKKALEILERTMPTELKEGATYKDLAEWYGKNSNKGEWCKVYDAHCKEKEGTPWDSRAIRWEDRAFLIIESLNNVVGNPYVKSSALSTVGHIVYGNKRPLMGHKMEFVEVMLVPRRCVYDVVINQIRESLYALRKEIEAKCFSIKENLHAPTIFKKVEIKKEESTQEKFTEAQTREVKKYASSLLKSSK